MEKKINIKLLLVVLSLVLVIGLSIAFAYLSRTLKINGNSKVDPANWDIHFTNLSEPILKGKANVVDTPTIKKEGASIDNIKVNLSLPADEVIYTVDLENSGDINAEIDSIEYPELTSSQEAIFEFRVYYTDTKDELKQGDTLQPNEVRNVTISIKYKDITDKTLLPKEVQEVNLSYKLTYVQSNQKIINKLPKEYTELESIYNNSTTKNGPYLKIPFTFTNDMTLKFVISYTKNFTNGIGIYNSGNSRLYQVALTASNAKASFKYGSVLYQDETPKLLSNTIYTLELTPNGGYVDGEKVCEASDVSGTGSYIITGYLENARTLWTTSLHIHKIEVLQGENTLLKCIPALDPNGKPCMYDLVTKQPFYNQGTGEFLYELKE